MKTELRFVRNPNYAMKGMMHFTSKSIKFHIYIDSQAL